MSQLIKMDVKVTGDNQIEIHIPETTITMRAPEYIRKHPRVVAVDIAKQLSGEFISVMVPKICMAANEAAKGPSIIVPIDIGKKRNGRSGNGS